MRAQPDHKATQREVIRKCCSNKKVADLKALHWVLRIHGIHVEHNEKWEPVIYIWKKRPHKDINTSSSEQGL